MTTVKCSVCGEGLSQKTIRELAMDDLDPEFSIVEKRFQVGNWWLESGEGHECPVIEAL